MSISRNPNDWAGLIEDEDEARKPTFKRDKHGVKRQLDLKYEFDCPECSANNPYDEGFKDGSEIRCHYCAQAFLVQILDESRMKLKPI
jgi:DNA-directed RNA polymerase subunit RPC12/RpoP